MINPINKHPTEQVAMNILQYLNYNINGVLYCIVGTRFRNELLDTLCWRKTTQVPRNNRDRVGHIFTTKASRDIPGTTTKK